MIGRHATRARSDKEYCARCKRALIVADWINGVPSSEIEQSFTVNPFSSVEHTDIRGFANGIRFLLGSAMGIAAIVLGVAIDAETNVAFFRRLEFGIPAGALPLTELGVELNRGELLRLWQRGIRTRENVATLPREDLETLIGMSGRKLFAAVNVEIPVAV